MNRAPRFIRATRPAPDDRRRPHQKRETYGLRMISTTHILATQSWPSTPPTSRSQPDECVLPNAAIDDIGQSPQAAVQMSLGVAIAVLVAWSVAAFAAGAWKTTTREI
jgi:hypothetical protein